ncbi:MAG: nuclear transport factor 2 family protein [Gammaproteobacteria bacterium]|nr:nuclear transport factor 2 family protein [Gammaproteobacteria bacterium]NIR97659.1 nuclear transport factor 2 family protein [Gammaproteobacteria bacterium]NIT63320.1 nuclear transport factor 2 family protein [Gammaproteobacteria bacterium]NIV20238.1 DUF4440 domain-containing protein [Gammaproteobacteria bacterium]NIX10655.1 DUF4440 domain-containing protein [Gammaproteobacteria bacterium]
MDELLTPEAAEAAFYRAFEGADLDAMMGVWADDEAIACIHPMGQMLRGTADVREAWRQLFAGNQRMHFHIRPQQHRSDGNLAIHTVIQSIYLHGEAEPRPPIVATNVYRRTEQGWRMILHHASPSVIDAKGGEAQQTEPTAPLH